MLNKSSVAVLGSTGYVGLELVYLLSLNKEIKINFLGSESNSNINISKIDSRIKKKLPKIKLNKEFDCNQSDIVFLCLPHKISQSYVKKFYGKIKIIDLSADFRLDNANTYYKNYSIKHSSPKLLKKFIYGLYEINYDKIKKNKYIAVPGCYPTSVLLPLIPLVKNNLIETDEIIIDSKSGYSGAGKNFDKNNLFKFGENLNFYNYNTNDHRHICEIKQELEKNTKNKVNFSFNPHILPIFRGMMSTMYCNLKRNISIKKLNDTLKKSYKNFEDIEIITNDIRVDFNSVQNTNKCFIKLFNHYNSSKVVIVSLIDNLQKGAAGQAIQCMTLINNQK
tara:strand:+ start:1525 stop:2532 length:1008 start_codon:yes stop_codon:yes gene_type:complete